MEPITNEERVTAIEYLKGAVAESPNPDETLFEGGTSIRQVLVEVENSTPLGKSFLKAWVEDEREKVAELPITKHISGNIEKGEDGLFSATFKCTGLDVEHLGRVIDAIEEAAGENTFITMPVIRELEDPAFMDELERRRDDPGKSLPWSQIKVEMTLRRVQKSDDE